jgi:ABC-type nitrate/sulfonate/bicarbonate transport system substrate-binding protein
VIWEPFAFNLRQSLGERAVSWSAQGNTFFYWTLMSRQGVLEARPQLSERLARCMLEAVSFINGDPGEAKRIVAEWTGLDESYLEYAWPLNRFEVSLDQALLLQLDRQAQWFKGSGLAGDAPIPNYLKRIDFTGLESADPGAVDIVH